MPAPKSLSTAATGSANKPTEKPRKKVGRPKITKQKTSLISARVTGEELMLVQKKASKGGFKNVSSFLREVVLGIVARDGSEDGQGSAVVCEPVKPELRQLIYQVNSTGINLNQIAKAIHERHLVAPDAVLEAVQAVALQNEKLEDRLGVLFKRAQA